jgi:DMSO/TMAO reductase YedYZ molybdopterin-dependent catalytic subunit
VRYHLAGIPTMDALGTWSLTVGGQAAERQVTFSMQELQNQFE